MNAEKAPTPTGPTSGMMSRTISRLGGYSGSVVVIGLALFIVVTPHLRPGSIKLYDLKRLLEIGLLLGIATIPVLSSSGRSRWMGIVAELGAPTRIAVSAFFLLGALSAALSVDPLNAFLEVAHFGLLAICIVSVAALYQSRPDTTSRVLLGIILTAVVVYIFAFLRDYLVSQLGLARAFREHPNALWPWGEFLGFANTRFFNQFQTWTFPLVLLPLATGRKSPLVRAALFSVPSIWWMLLFASGGRGTVFALVLSAVLILVVSGRTQLRYVTGFATTAIAGGLLYFILFKLLGDTSASLADRQIGSPNGRFNFWMHAADLLRSSPLLGVGPGQYAWFHHRSAAHPHNSIVQIFSEWGILAGSLVLYLSFSGLRRLIRTCRAARVGDFAFAAVLTSLFAGLVHSLLSGLIVMPVSQIMMAVVIGWLWGASMTPYPDHLPRTYHQPRPLATFAFLTVVLVMILAETSLSVLSYRRLAYMRAEPTWNEHRELPRFWRYGCPRNHDDRYPLLPQLQND